jgi:signal transduction histidine kinase
VTAPMSRRQIGVMQGDGAEEPAPFNPVLALEQAVIALRGETAPARVLQLLAREARNVTGAQLCATLIRAEAGRGWAIASSADDGAGARSAVRFAAGPGTLIGRVLESRRPVWIEGPEGQQELGLAFEVGSLGLVPVITEGVVFAVLALIWPEPGSVSGDSRARADVLAQLAGLAVELSALKNELEQTGLRAEMTARAEGAEALHRVAAEVAGRRDPVGIAADAVTALIRHYSADAGAFYIVDDEGRSRNLVCVGLPSDLVEQVEASYSQGNRKLFPETRSQVITADGERRGVVRSLHEREGISSLVRVPAVSEGRIVGVLVLYHRQPHAYRLHELALLEHFAVQLAGGLRLAQAYTALEQADRKREEFLALISHELRHPVAAIATIAESLADTPGLGAREARALDGLRAQARSLAWMAEEVLQVARLETGMLKPRPSRVDLGRLVGALLREAPQSERLRLEAETELYVDVDAELIGRVVDNLVRNALKYSPPATEVSVSVRADGEEALFEVSDQGMGLREADMAQLFKKYGRITQPKTSGLEGIGLGLYLTRMLVEAHGGRIWASSPGPDLGATFSVRLPRAG